MGRQAHSTNSFRINNLTTVTTMENAESTAGCRYSELLLLPYFDAPKMLVIHPMHAGLWPCAWVLVLPF